MNALDRRLNAYRPDLASADLEGEVEADRFVTGRPAQIGATSAPVHDKPDFASEMTTEALRGETLRVFDESDGWAWVQLDQDSYVGYLPSDCLAHGIVEGTVEVSVPRTFVFSEPSIKSKPLCALSLGSRIALNVADDDFGVLDEGGYVMHRHVAAAGTVVADWVSVAEWYLGTPYLWGGKQSTGIDCSGLVQIAARAGGHEPPRDSDMMRNGFGNPLDAMRWDALQRGDLVFWKGHVGIMRDETTLLHPNAFHMMCVSEPLHEAVTRIAASAGDILAINRLP